jgi:mannose-6-phosphate isomerase-like protein (cupin superfamily)
MDIFHLPDLLRQHADQGRLYLEFLNHPSLSVGLYRLSAGSKDTQSPHTEDEVYYIIDGEGQIMVDGEDQPVHPGSVIFVAAHVEHRFHSITRDLDILVIFAPAEYSNAAK